MAGVDPEPELERGVVLDERYRIERVLGAGGVGVVYLAEDLKLPHQVAVKVLQRQHVAHHSLRGRFEREARALAAMKHPNIVSVSDYGISDERPFVVMELLEGKTLRELIDEGPMKPERAFDITKQLLKGLSYAHRRGLVHRDIKPGNVFLQEIEREPEVVKILDFGFAKWLTDEPRDSSPVVSNAGIVMGTPSYLPPEQAAGDETDARTDIYAVGVLLFEMLAGVKPFTGNLIELLRQHLTVEVPKIAQVSRTRKESPELRKVIKRAMAKRKADRFEDASEFLAAIKALPQPAIKEKGRAALKAATAGLALACIFAGAVLWIATRPDPQAEIARLRAGAGGALGATADSGATSPPTPQQDEDTGVAPDDGEPPLEEADAGADADAGASGATLDVVRQVRDLVDQNQMVSEDQVTALRTYARDNDSGPVYLLLAHVYSQRNWWSDAVRNYRSAFEAEPRIADDPVVLDNLLHISAMSEAADVDAFDVVKRIYGRDALEAVEAILADEETGWQEKRQLRRLQRELRRLPAR